MARHQKRSFGEILLAGGEKKTAAIAVLIRDANEKALVCSGTSVPVNGGTGYAIGAEFYLTNAAYGQCPKWRNFGTSTSCAFRPEGGVVGYGFGAGGGSVPSAGGDTTEVLSDALQGRIRGTDISFAMHRVCDDNDQIVAQIASDGEITLTVSADPTATAKEYVWACLKNGCVPEYDIFAAGTKVTAGGAAYEDITVTGVNASDLVFACYSATNDTDTIAKAAYQTTNTIRVTMSADPSTAHGLHYMVLRPRGSFRPSHYVFAAGVFTTVGGDTTEVITVAGALATDIPFVAWNTTDDTDTILKSVMTANTLTCTLSADPATAHKLAYVIMRAY